MMSFMTGGLSIMMKMVSIKTMLICGLGIASVLFIHSMVTKAINYGAQTVELERLAEAQANANRNAERRKMEAEAQIKARLDVEAKYASQKERLQTLRWNLALATQDDESIEVMEGMATCPANCLLSGSP